MEKHLVRAFLLQHPRVECDGKPLNIRLKKAQALLFYLLVQKKATREEAAGLLWGGEEDSLAHRHLRDNLYQLKKAALVELLDLAHEQMTFYGIQTYQTQVMREHIQIALALTQGRDPAPLDRYLDQSCESYCAQSRSALKGKAGVFELELLHRLDLGSADPLPGLLQVTEN